MCRAWVLSAQNFTIGETCWHSFDIHFNGILGFSEEWKCSVHCWSLIEYVEHHSEHRTRTEPDNMKIFTLFLMFFTLPSTNQFRFYALHAHEVLQLQKNCKFSSLEVVRIVNSCNKLKLLVGARKLPSNFTQFLIHSRTNIPVKTHERMWNFRMTNLQLQTILLFLHTADVSKF